MLVQVSRADIAAPDDLADVFLLPGHVGVLLADDTPAEDVRPVVLLGGREIDLGDVATTRVPGLDGAADLVLLTVNLADQMSAPSAKLQIWVLGFLLHEQALAAGGGGVTGRIEGVRDNHIVGWAAHALGETPQTLRLYIDGVAIPRARVALTDHPLCRHLPQPACTGFRVAVPRQAMDGARHSFRLLVDDHFLPEFTWSGAAGLFEEDAPAASERVPDFVFDRASYAALYPDIAGVLAQHPDFDLADHFWQCGIDEGRLPSLFFDIEFVQHTLRKAGDVSLSRRDTIDRFLAVAPKNRFVPNRWFSTAIFRFMYADLIAADLSDYEVFLFYMDHAAAARLSPCGLFNEAIYRDRYPDVDEGILAGGFRSGFHHFMVAGWRLRRENLFRFGDGIFPPPERSREEREMLFHRFAELRPVVPWFDETFYLQVYADAREQKRRGRVRSGLEHFLVHGCREGRVPHPALLGVVRRAQGDLPAFLAGCADLAAPLPAGLTLDDATELYERIAADGRAHERAALSRIVWALVQRPWLDGSFNAERYLAANPDLAEMFGHDHRHAHDHAHDHWREHGIREGRAAPGSSLFANRALTATDVLRGGTGVNFFGPLSLSNGLAAAAHGTIDALRFAGVEVDAYDVSGLIHDDAHLQLVAPGRLRHSINLIFLNPDRTLPLAARYGTQLFDHRINVAFWVWELPAARPEWRATLGCYDLILTPSDFCTNAFAGETSTAVVTVPYVVDHVTLVRHLAAYQANRWIDRLVAEKQAGRKVVLFIMDASSYTPRKGADVFVRMARLAEAAHPGRFLFVMKTHSRSHIADDAGAEKRPESLLVIDEVFSWPDLCKLKTTADILISPHRSEGFGLNIFESIVLGVPVICSPFGGGPDALPADFPFFIAGQEREIGAQLGPYRASSIWFDPDPASALELLVAFFANEPEHRRYFARLQQSFIRTLSAETVGAKLWGLLARHCGLGLNAGTLAGLFDRGRAECFDFDMGTALTDGSQSVSAMVESCLSPKFSVITPTWNSDPMWLMDLYEDLCAQTLQSWEWCIHDDGSTRQATLDALRALRARDARIKLHLARDNAGISHATNGAVRISSAADLIFVDHDDRLSPDLLASYAEAIDAAGRPDILYCDEDKLFPDGSHRDHYFKPDWSPEHLLSTMYALHCLSVRKSLFLKLGGYRTEYSGAQDHDFLLRAMSDGARVKHVAKVLYHWRVSNGSSAHSAATKPYADDAGRRAVADYLRRTKLNGTVEAGLLPGTYRVRPLVPAGTVSLNILTSFARPASGGGAYVNGLVRSILAHDHPVEIEIRLVTDAAAMPAARSLARLDTRIKVVKFDRGDQPFNFSEKANFAIRGSATDRNVLLNDDMEAVDGGWLAALLEVLELPDVGIVSGRLLYGDDTVQHSGIVLGVNGAASHVFMGAAPDYVGYNAFTHVIRNYSAVTGAMMAFRRSLFDEIGGFDTEFPIDFNDTDFCLRVIERGRRIVFTPFARMRHFESRSAVRLAADSYDEYRFTQKWRRYIDRDPYYNENLRRDTMAFEAAATA